MLWMLLAASPTTLVVQVGHHTSPIKVKNEVFLNARQISPRRTVVLDPEARAVIQTRISVTQSMGRPKRTRGSKALEGAVAVHNILALATGGKTVHNPEPHIRRELAKVRGQCTTEIALRPTAGAQHFVETHYYGSEKCRVTCWVQDDSNASDRIPCEVERVDDQSSAVREHFIEHSETSVLLRMEESGLVVKDEAGPVVAEVKADSAAERAGFQSGDRITRVGAPGERSIAVRSFEHLVRIELPARGRLDVGLTRGISFKRLSLR